MKLKFETPKVQIDRKIPARPEGVKENELTKFIESKAEYAFVKKILPMEIVPEPPKHESYPTPSGWVPPNYAKAKSLPYQVLRTRFHQFPIYHEEREGGSRKLTVVKQIQGEIWVRFNC